MNAVTPEKTKNDLVMITPDQLKTWTRCQKKFLLQYKRRLQWPGDARNFALGRDVHKLMDYVSRGLSVESLLHSATEDVRLCFEGLMRHESAHWEILASEWAFTVPFKDVFANDDILMSHNVWLTGRMDRVSIQRGNSPEEDRIVILDWKTGTATPKLPADDWQTRCYLYAMVEAAPQLLGRTIQPEQVSMVYVEVRPKDLVKDPNAVRVASVPYDTALHTANRLSIVGYTQAILQAQQYPLPATCPDPFCAYRSVCGILQTNPEGSDVLEGDQNLAQDEPDEAYAMLDDDILF